MASGKTIIASLGAMFTSLLTLGCCLPLPFLGAAGIAGVSVYLGVARPWLLGFSVALLGLGCFQVYRGMRCQARQNKIAIALLGLTALLIVFLLFFPQVLAGLLANTFSGQKVSAGQPALG